MLKHDSIYLLSAGVEKLASAFTPEETQWVASELQGLALVATKGVSAVAYDLASSAGCGVDSIKSNPPNTSAPSLFIAGHCGSTFELAWRLIDEGRLPAWGAALGLVQEAGRGQLRRNWYSPLGNMHVSFRLPSGGPFAGSAATVLLGLLFCEAFEALGLKLSLKWPNDLVLDSGAALGKLGGILLEEKNSTLVAGIGINLASIPACGDLRAGAALPPALLPNNFVPTTPICLWLTLVKSLIMIYSSVFMTRSHAELLRRAEARLLWRGREVLVSSEYSGDEPFYGVITGLSAQGGLMLLSSDGARVGGTPRHREVNSGSIVGT